MKIEDHTTTALPEERLSARPDVVSREGPRAEARDKDERSKADRASQSRAAPHQALQRIHHDHDVAHATTRKHIGEI